MPHQIPLPRRHKYRRQPQGGWQRVPLHRQINQNNLTSQEKKQQSISARTNPTRHEEITVVEAKAAKKDTTVASKRGKKKVDAAEELKVLVLQGQEMDRTPAGQKGLVSTTALTTKTRKKKHAQIEKGKFKNDV